MRRLAATLALVTGCGLGPFAGEGGGGDNLPTLGGGPYGKLPLDLDTPIDEPFVLSDAVADLSDPTAMLRDDGGIRLWVTRRAPDQAAEIWTAELPALTELPDVAPTPVLVAELEWEAGEVRAPSVLADGDRLLLFYEAGDPAGIGRAVSTDGGNSFTRDPAPVIEGARQPSAVSVGGQVVLFFERAGAPGIFAAESTDGGASFSSLADPVLEINPVDEAFDLRSVSSPGAVAAVTATGRTHVGLFYEGRSDQLDDNDAPLVSIGYAGGFSIDELFRFGDGVDPILDPLPPSERTPSAIVLPDRGMLFFTERRGSRLRIAAAVHP